MAWSWLVGLWIVSWSGEWRRRSCGLGLGVEVSCRVAVLAWICQGE